MLARGHRGPDPRDHLQQCTGVLGQEGYLRALDDVDVLRGGAIAPGDRCKDGAPRFPGSGAGRCGWGGRWVFPVPQLLTGQAHPGEKLGQEDVHVASGVSQGRVTGRELGMLIVYV